ncbi:uncharacterized protein [Apostichopus japonicus]|uniref:uncharacterized protein n=1 Tax=Stichopus japonicus TaxID=307972 RepID=UPI003AB350B4
MMDFEPPHEKTGSSLTELSLSLNSLEKEVATFPKELKSIFLQEEIDLLSKRNKHFDEIKVDIKQDIDMYIINLLPLCKEGCINLVKLFDKYQLLEFPDWLESIEKTKYDVQCYRHFCETLIKLHEFLAISLDEKQEKVNMFASELEQEVDIQDKEALSLVAKAEKKKKLVTVSSFVPFVGLFPAVAMKKSLKKNEDDAMSRIKLSYLMRKIHKLMTDVLLPTVISFKENIQATHVFFGVIEDELIIFSDYAQQASVVKEQTNAHFTLMKGKSAEIKRHCRLVGKILSIVKSDASILRISEEELTQINERFLTIMDKTIEQLPTKYTAFIRSKANIAIAVNTETYC